MIWYLLYPLRGTAAAPVLDPAHPIRVAFTRYGKYAAKYVVTTLLVSIAVATLLIYPFPFLYTNDFTNGASSLPRHVWTNAQPLDRSTNIEPDVIMRTIWVHGSYMRAFETDVLLGALDLQDYLLGSTQDFNPGGPKDRLIVGTSMASDLSISQRDSLHVFNGLTPESWFFHSPLQYWAGSKERILADPDITATVNAQKSLPTSVNVTLRHSIVFSGTHFQDRRLVAADALVITLIHLRDSPVGHQWERKSETLATTATDRWQVYPSDGQSMPSQLYEFQFLPISVKDILVLGMAYLGLILYVLWRLPKFRAAKSKAGLILTMVVQTTFSILSSFTICAILEIDLSRLPGAAYPMAVLAMGLENIFRLINAVAATPPEDSTSSRIGYAYGETTFESLASCIQSSLFLLAVSRLPVVYPPVAAFCVFVAISVQIDFFYMSTFFLAVLSVDVRRAELGDALAKASLLKSRLRTNSLPKISLLESLFNGKIAFSTRLAGTLIVLAFVVIAQWHFFDWGLMAHTWGLMVNITKKVDKSLQPRSTLLLGVNQARSPTSWLRQQDHETAKEVIQVIKPQAHSYVAQVYDPMVFVLKGADRKPTALSKQVLPPAVLDFAHHQMLPFLATVVFLLVSMRLLIRYLLWKNSDDQKYEQGDDGSLLSVTTMTEHHSLDVALLGASADGHLISIGLDRVIRVWNLRSGSQSYTTGDLDDTVHNPFPVLNVSVDRESNLVALLSSTKVNFWNLRQKRWGVSVDIDLQGSKIELMQFCHDSEGAGNSLAVLRRNGVLTELHPSGGASYDTEICSSAIVSAQILPEQGIVGHSPYNMRIIMSTRHGCIHVATQSAPLWTCKNVTLAKEGVEVDSLIALPVLNSCLVVYPGCVDLYDVGTDHLVYTFETEPIQPRSLRCLYTTRKLSECGSTGLGTLTLAYCHGQTGELILQTYTPPQDEDVLCFLSSYSPGDPVRCLWQGSNMIKRVVPNPGKWDTLPAGYIIGIRQTEVEDVTQPTLSATSPSSQKPSGLRRRIFISRPAVPHNPAEAWEVWMMSNVDKAECEEETAQLCPEADGHLFVGTVGPMIRVGTSSIAVALGNVVKVVKVGNERFNVCDEDDKQGRVTLGRGRRKIGKKGQ